jgi:hypothetical protein
MDECEPLMTPLTKDCGEGCTRAAQHTLYHCGGYQLITASITRDLEPHPHLHTDHCRILFFRLSNCEMKFNLRLLPPTLASARLSPLTR